MHYHCGEGPLFVERDNGLSNHVLEMRYCWNPLFVSDSRCARFKKYYTIGRCQWVTLFKKGLQRSAWISAPCSGRYCIIERCPYDVLTDIGIDVIPFLANRWFQIAADNAGWKHCTFFWYSNCVEAAWGCVVHKTRGLYWSGNVHCGRSVVHSHALISRFVCLVY